MNNEMADIAAFINKIPPFDAIEPNQLDKLLSCIVICYIKQEKTMPPQGNNEPRLYLIRSGSLRACDNLGELTAKYGEGDIVDAYFSNHGEQLQITADEDCLLYSLPRALLLERKLDAVLDFFELTAEQRIGKKVDDLVEDAVAASALGNALVADFYNSPIEQIEPYASIQQAAIKMTELDVSCLVVELEGTVAIVTDKDIRRRCVAQGLPFDTAVSEIVSKNVHTLDVKSGAFDALTFMTAKQIHHIPVTEQGKVIGMLTATDLINNEGQNAVNFNGLIRKANTVEALVDISHMLPNFQIRLTRIGTKAEHVAKNISAVIRALTVRLIELAISELGPAPVPFAWLAAGSLARHEQFINGDQDNALIIDNSMQDEHQDYFKHLAYFVCSGLDACGFIYCPGDIMASNQQWRQTQAVWQGYFERWVHKPDPQALLNCSVFFDLDTLYGDASLLNQIKENTLKQTQKSSLFLAHLTKNALQLTPPLGLFRDFVLIKAGEHKETLDIKHRGLAPIVDLARIYALSSGCCSVNTIDRLTQAAGTNAVTQASAKSLIDAYHLLLQLRLEHQARQIKAGVKADNYLSLKAISRLERNHLKDAFKVIKTLQESRQSVY